MTTKQELRQMIRQRKLQHSVDESSAVIARLKENQQFAEAHTLLLYSALPDEVQTQALLDELTMQGKTVLLPRVVSDTEMELCRYTGRQDLRAGAFGIMEPVGELFTDYAEIDVAVIPGMAFDAEGHRLGRGKGYYDRFLSPITHHPSPNTHHPSPNTHHLYKIGLCFSWQLVDHVPSDAHDVRMDCVISQSEHR